MMSKQPIPNSHKYTLKDALTSLHQRGKLEEETALKQRIQTHFGGLFTEEELLQMPLVDLRGIVTVFNKIYPIITSDQDINEEKILSELKEEIKSTGSCT